MSMTPCCSKDLSLKLLHPFVLEFPLSTNKHCPTSLAARTAVGAPPAPLIMVRVYRVQDDGTGKSS